MFVVLKTLNSFLKLLHSETAPSQLAAGVAFGMMVGLTPFMSLHNLVIFLIVCLFRVNFSIFFMSLAVFSILGFLMDPFFDWLGYVLLVDLRALRPFWILLMSGPIIPFFRFNNTIVTGSLTTSLFLFVPVFISFYYFVNIYRRSLREKLINSRFVKALRATPLYGFYQKYQNFREKLSVFQ